MANHTTFKALGVSIKRHAGDIGANALAAQVRIAKQLAYNLISRTPADTGKARSNWIAKRNTPPSGTRRTFAPGHLLGIGEQANLAAAYYSAAAVFDAAGPEDRLYLKNNLPYINRLNAGHSKQAPIGFVEAEMLKAEAELKRIRLIGRARK